MTLPINALREALAELHLDPAVEGVLVEIQTEVEAAYQARVTLLERLLGEACERLDCAGLDATAERIKGEAGIK